MFLDHHTHISDTVFEKPGIRKIYSLDISKAREIQAISEILSAGQAYSIGLHPMSIHAMPLPHIWEILHQHIDKALAIGECGLDTRIDIPRNQQIEIFRAQAELSMEWNKPLIIHCVRAYDDIIALHKLLKPQNPWIIHGFNRNERIASMLLEQGILLSIGKELLNTRHPLSTFFTKITHYPFFLESDGKDIAIETLYQKAAQLLDRSIEEISSIIEKHVQQVYGRYTSNSTPLE